MKYNRMDKILIMLGKAFLAAMIYSGVDAVVRGIDAIKVTKTPTDVDEPTSE